MTANKGFTLVEVLVTVGILAFVLSGLLAMYVNLFLLGDINRQTTLANNSAQARIEEIRNTNFDNLPALNGTVFDITGFGAGSAKGRVEVSNTSYSDLRLVRVVVSFKQKGSMIIGEDTNLNGVLDGGEDVNANGRLDSSIEIVTLISR